MKNLKLVALSALVVSPAITLAQDLPFEFGYQWSLSGKEYATMSRTLKTFDQFSFDLVGGYEVDKNVAPSLGFGASYRFADADGFYFRAGVFALFPQKSKPDLGFGLTFGVGF